MKKFLMGVIAGLVFLYLPPVAWAQDTDGRQIMETQKDRHRVKSAKDHVLMLLINKKGHRKIRELKRYGKEFENGLGRTMLVFTAPADLKGTTLMTWEISKGEYKQWIHLPGQRSLQRIADKAKRTSFMGSDFTYEDLQPENPDNYTFTLIKSEVLDGHDCFVINVTAATPAIKKASGYGRRLVWVRKDIYFTLKVEFYNKRDKLIKTQTSHGLKNSHDSVWYAEKVIMVNHKKNHKTLMGIKSKEVNVPIDDALFTEKTILSKKHM